MALARFRRKCYVQREKHGARRRLEYQKAEGEGADDRERDRDGGELDLTDVADEDVGDWADAVLANDVEANRSSDQPQFRRLSTQNSLHIAPGSRRSVILHLATVGK